MITGLIRAMEEQCTYDPTEQLTVGRPYPSANLSITTQAREVEEQYLSQWTEVASILP